jgi:CBS domain-containing protein
MKAKVFYLSTTSTILEAAAIITKHHIGLLPVVDGQMRLCGVVSLQDLLSLELPAILTLIDDLDFVNDFGAIETTRPSYKEVSRPITEIMQPPTYVYEDSGPLFAYSVMLKHNLYDLPVVSKDMSLVGIVSRVDIAARVLSSWDEIQEIPQ